MGKTSITWFALWLLAGCGGSGEVSHTPGESGRSRSIVDDNGVDLNGLMANGLMQNGLTVNGAQFNGAQFNGAQFNGFSINGLSLDQSLSVMKYLVKCALADGQTMTINVDGTDYSWPGRLGLAPEWANGPLTNDASQAWVSGCLMALSNADGRSVSISLRADFIPYSVDEVTGYSVPEAVYFGNLFSTGPWAYACPLYAPTDSGYLSGLGRRCAMSLDSNARVSQCNLFLTPECQVGLSLCQYLDPLSAGGGGYFDCSQDGSITVYDQNY